MRDTWYVRYMYDGAMEGQFAPLMLVESDNALNEGVINSPLFDNSLSLDRDVSKKSTRISLY